MNDSTKRIICAPIAGLIEGAIMHPLDTLKTWSQNKNLGGIPKLNFKNLYAGFSYPLLSNIVLNIEPQTK